MRQDPPARRGMRSRLKVAVAKAGIDNTRADVLFNLAKVETWRRRHVPADCPTFADRVRMYEYLHGECIGDRALDYLEFGVYEGGSIRCWAELNRHRESRFVGFDTFTGLPEQWHRIDARMQAGAFDTGGAVPQIDDDRVAFVPGLFQDTLGGFVADFTPRAPLVVHCDADLYSSTLFVLSKCDDILAPGSIVVFDEFSSVLNEFAALADYCNAYRREYDVLAATAPYFAQVAIRLR
ncbi:MAG: macrocin O-methyltransferase [Jatrophihabitans sp.]|nr:MAG: macrocin O-methyltransferase [Jatrophihabitans sp.]